MNVTANKVLEILYDREEAFLSVDELASGAGLTMRRLAEALAELEGRGHVLERRPAEGVRLARPVRLDAHLIERGLGTVRVGRNAICFPEVDSTNDVAFEAAAQEDCDGLAVLAEYQRRGRGRQGRLWVSPPGMNILLSVLLLDEPDRLPQEAVTIAAGLAAAEGIREACGVACRLKWPNDVWVEGAKVAGVLVEVRRRACGRCVVVGIGVNVNASPPPDGTGWPATDLARHAGVPVERIEVARGVLRRLDFWVGEIAAGRLEGLRQAWVGLCGILNERAAVTCGARRYVGRVLDVSPLEGLVLACDDGRTVRLPADNSSLALPRRSPP